MEQWPSQREVELIVVFANSRNSLVSSNKVSSESETVDVGAQKEKNYYSIRNIVGCLHPNCSLHAHGVKVMSDRFIFKIPFLKA